MSSLTPRPVRKATPPKTTAGLNRNGRTKGSKNLVTKATLQTLLQTHFLQPKETAQDIWRQILGLEDPNPEKLDGKAIGNRQRLTEIYREIGKPNKQRKYNLTDRDIAALRLAAVLGYGTPNKMEKGGAGKPRMPYIGRHGLPWQYDVMFEQEQQALEAQKDQEKLDAAARERQLKGEPEDPKPDEDDGEETLEIVRG